jgi:hypothetical protein
MLSFSRRAGALAVLLISAACADRPNPFEPAPSTEPPPTSPLDGGPGLSRQQARHERLARRMAIGLRDPDFRAAVFGALRKSGEREGKVHLQRLLGEAQGRARHRLAELAGELESALAADLDAGSAIEIYLPVPGHRRQWLGTPNVLVATAEGDHDAPVAFDTWGRRRSLDPDLPPPIPVIALGRAETAFGDGGLTLTSCLTCDEDPDGGLTGGGTGGTGGSTGGLPTAIGTAGLYMTYANFTGTFEGWLKGDPEFEVHILGKDGGANAMRTYQCAGEKAGGPYRFDQNAETWSGNVLLFSQAQFAEYEAAQPGQAVRLLVLEDDDASCVIKTDSARVDRLLRQIVATYGTLVGGKNDSSFSVKTFKKAVSVWNLAKTFWSFITTQDDIVGYAIEDTVAAEFFPPANWVVKGDNTITNGAIRLEMR